MSMLSPTMGAATMARRGPQAAANIFDDFIRSSKTPGSVIVEMTAYPKDASTLGAPFPPTMGFATMGLKRTAGGVGPGAITVNLSADGVRFGPDDPVSPGYKTEGVLAKRVNVRSQIEIEPELSSSAVISVGDIEVNDQHGRLESRIHDYSWAGRRVRVLYGPRGATLANYRVIADTYARDWLRSDAGLARLRLQDLQFALDRKVQGREFGGTGGLEGDPGLSGRLKPRLLGRRTNFAPVLIGAATRWWMYNDGPATGLTAARYGGEAIPVTTFANLTDFATFALPEGQAADCPSLGICRDRPAGGIASPFTIEAVGDNDDGTVTLLGDLIAKVFRQFAAFDLTKYDAASLQAFNIGEGGYWADGSSSVTIKTIVDKLALDAGGKLAPGSQFRALTLRDPEDAGYDFEIRESEIAKLELLGRQSAPVADIQVRWKPNDRKLTAAEIVLPDSNPAFKAYLQTDYKTTTPQPDGRVVLENLDFVEQSVFETSLVQEAGVSELVTRLRRFFRRERFIWDVHVNTKEALLWPIGSIVRIVHRRKPWFGGRNALVVRNEADFDAQRAKLRVLI